MRGIDARDRLRGRNLALGGALLALAILFFLATMAKIGGNL